MQRRIEWIIAAIVTIVFCGVWAWLEMTHAVSRFTGKAIPWPMLRLYGGIGVMSASGMLCLPSFIGLLISPKESRVGTFCNALFSFSILAWIIGYVVIFMPPEGIWLMIVPMCVFGFISLLLFVMPWDPLPPHIWISTYVVGAALFVEVILYSLLPTLHAWLTTIAPVVRAVAETIFFWPL